jgi:uracil-DNA glycosylase family 4
VWITAAVRCAPPDNKPTPEEFANCHEHLRAELAALPDVRVFVALGRLAFDACLRVLRERGEPTTSRPPFAHGSVFQSTTGITLVASYHPSRQNTHTGRLTPQMLRSVFSQAKQVASR